MNQIAIKAKTVSSIELVEIINSAREAGRAVLTHANFLAKIKKVLGEASHKFLGDAQITVGGGAVRSSKCFYLPKREASLMVMSESYEVQAKVYDRMTELEVAVKKASLKYVPNASLSAVRQAKAFKDNATTADYICSKFPSLPDSTKMSIFNRVTGVELFSAPIIEGNLVASQAKPIPEPEISPEPEKVNYLAMTATELGLTIGLSAQKTNMELYRNGFQEKSGKEWIPTEKGLPYAVIINTGIKRLDGSDAFQVRWHGRIKSVISKSTSH